MKFHPLLILVAAIIFSCNKKSSTPAIPNPPVEQDTLAPGWSKKIVSGASTFLDIFFINNTGFAMADSGIYKSIDGGDNWDEKVPGVAGGSSNINLGMGSETNVSIVLGPGRIVSSHDGGASFDTVAIADVGVTDVFYVDSITAYAAGKSIWKTTDAGSHWTKLYDFTGTVSYQTLFFLNDQTGWIIRYDGLYKTTNGGVNWQPITIGNQFNFVYDGVVFFVNANHGFVADSVSVGTTTNGGTSWSKVYGGKGGYHDLFFVDDNTGYVTDDRYIFKTIDGGTTWTKEASIPGTKFFELHFTDANHGWACGSNGTILKFKQP